MVSNYRLRFSLCLALIITILCGLPKQTIASGQGEFDQFTDRLFYGGTVGMYFGRETQVDIVPIAGIWILPQWSVGASGRYSYYSQRNLIEGSYRAHIWGYSGFTQIIPVRDLSEVTSLKARGGLFLHGEYERLYLDQRMVTPASGVQEGKTWIDIALVGGGYRQKIGDRAALNLMVLWQVNDTSYSPYRQSPIIRVTFTL